MHSCVRLAKTKRERQIAYLKSKLKSLRSELEYYRNEEQSVYERLDAIEREKERLKVSIAETVSRIRKYERDSSP